MLHVERSLEVARSITVEKKACWSNAFTAFLVNEQLHSGQYVEGWAIPDMDGLRLNLEHGWVEGEDGNIIDPTFAVLGHTRVEYFPALKLSYTEALKLVKKKATLPHVRRFGAGGFAYPPYLEAYNRSYEAAFGTPPPFPTKK